MQHRLAHVTREEALARAAAGAVVLLPVGALEQHGAHLPVGTDALTVEAVCLRAAERAEDDVLVAPPLAYGFSPHHVRFGATVSLSLETFVALVREVVAALREWAPRVVVVNGHGGNRGPLTALALETGVEVASWWELVGDRLRDGGSVGHAGDTETSVMLALAPELVGEPAAGFELPADRDLFVVDLGESGVIGDPHAASAAAGAELLDLASAALAARLLPRKEPP
jgi:creatinine amidohydrolase